MALGRRIGGWGGLGLASALAFAAWVCVVLVASRPAFRTIVDTTPGQRVSVRPATRNLIRDLQKRDDVRIEIYSLFERLPPGQDPRSRAYMAIWQRVQDMAVSLLRQYAALGGDKLTVEHLDQRRSPDRTRQIIERLGLTKTKHRHFVVVAVIRKGQDGGEAIQKRVVPVYDLAVVDGGGGAPVPGADQRMPQLKAFTGESQFSSAVKTLLAGGSPTVYWLEGHGEMPGNHSGSPYDYTNLVAGLKEDGFRIAGLNLRKEDVPKDAAVIACIEPKSGFEPAECERLLGWLRRGGRLLVNLSYEELDSHNPTLDNLLGRLGVRVGRQMVMQRWNDPNPAQSAFLEVKLHNSALPITKPLVAEGVTIGLERAREFTPGEPVDGAALDQSLLRTAPCWLAPRDRAGATSFVPPPTQVRGNYQPRCVGAIVTVAAEQGEHAGRVVLLGGVGFNNQRIDTGSQRDFVLNCFAWLADRSEVVDLGRDQETRDRIIQRGTDQDEFRARISRTWAFLVPGVPTAFLLLGVVVWWRRRRI